MYSSICEEITSTSDNTISKETIGPVQIVLVNFEKFCSKECPKVTKTFSFLFDFQELINAPDNISKCKAVMDFCRSRPSDVLPAHGE